MGEKIRDLGIVQFGKVKMTVELNEGYMKSEGRVIHVQNPHFRYYISESGFLELAATVLRAKEELFFFKENNMAEKEVYNNNPIPEEYSDRQREVLSHLSMIDFRVIEKTPKILSILVNPKGQKDLDEILSDEKLFQKLVHPYGEEYGYKFLYQMHPFKLYMFGGLVLEFFNELPAYSLSPKTWMPLDRRIQSRAWMRPDMELDDICFYIFKLSYAIFFEHAFTQKTIQHLLSRKHVLSCSEFSPLLETVFFKYTDHLVEKLKNDEFSDIIHDYFTFLDY